MFLHGNFALKPLQIGEIMSSNEIMQFSYFWKTNEKKADNKMVTMESAMTAILRDASGKMYHGRLFDRRREWPTLWQKYEKIGGFQNYDRK